ncbi:MAG: zincin-like metallopeptidase domain-containing protein [Dehalococcoidia bacterium]
MPRKATTARPDTYAAITDRIIAALDQGTVPWRQPWRSRGLRNAISGRSYRGINLLLLGLTALEGGFDDPRWLTYRQAQAKGGHVRRGERGTQIVLWKWIDRSDADTGETQQHYPLLRLFTVFNITQCDDVALPAYDEGGSQDPLAEADAIVAGYAGGPPVVHDADSAYYIPSRDEVHLPPRESFRDVQGYYATLFHELAHSTGHQSRLNREGYQSAARFGSEMYSREELVAEFTAAFLGQEAGTDPSRVEQSVAYIASWLKALRDDRRLVVIAAGQAQRAADHILGRGPEVAEVAAADEDPALAV